MKEIEKQPKKKEELLNIWINKGLTVENEVEAINIIQRLNYYRLTGYSKYFYNNKRRFKSGTSFNDIYNLYLFDNELRNIIREVVEEIELNFKSYFASYMSNKYNDVYAHLKNEYFECTTIKESNPSKTYYEEVKDIIEKKKDNNKNKPYIKHYLEEYGEVPIWVIVEVLSFNDMSKLIRNMKKADRKQMIKENYDNFPIKAFYLPAFTKLMCDIRNMCAHYEKIFNLNLENAPKLDRTNNIPNKTLYDILKLCKEVIKDTSKWNTLIRLIKTNINKYQFNMLELLGIHNENWESELLI